MRLSKKNIPFTMVANDILNRKDISWKAKGIYAYMFSKPDGWDFSAARIADDSSDGKRLVLGALKELEDAGCLERKRLSNGRVEYFLQYASEDMIEHTALSLIEEPEKEVVEKNDKERNSDIAELIYMFKAVNPNHQRLFGNKTQRAAIGRMLDIHGRKSVEGSIKYAIEVFGKPYAPTITTPDQLERKLGMLAAHFKKDKANRKGKEI